MLKIDLRLDNWHDILAAGKYDCIFHLAGNSNVQHSVEKPHVDLKLNLEPTFRLLEAIRKLGWPAALFMPHRRPHMAIHSAPNPGDRLHESSFPIWGEQAGGRALHRGVQSTFRDQAASMRTASAYGPRLRKQVVFDLFEKLLRQPHELEILGDGSQTRDFVFATDIARAAMVIAMFGDLRGEAYNVATGTSLSILKLAKLICLELRVRLGFESQAPRAPANR